MPMPTAQERRCLKAIAELKACDHIAVSRKVGISSDYADQLCRYLRKWGYVEKRGRRYGLTKTGEAAAAKEMEREKPKEPAEEKTMVWDKWLGGFKPGTQGGSMLPEEGLVWETYRGFGGGGTAIKQRELPELLWEEKYTCVFCNGQGYIYNPSSAKCPVCKGSGSVTFFEPPVVKCAYCKGKGRKDTTAYLTCTVCKGKGLVPVKEPIELCSACQGKGYCTEDRLPCTLCKGKGVITVRESIL